MANFQISFIVEKALFLAKIIIALNWKSSNSPLRKSMDKS